MTLKALKRDLKSSNITGASTPGELETLNNKGQDQHSGQIDIVDQSTLQVKK